MNEIFTIMKDLNFSNVIWEIMTPLIFSLSDIISGYIQALINKNVDSQKMRSGLLHKSLIILILILSFTIEFAFNIGYISKIVSIYIVIMEIGSILENLKKAGVNIGKLGNLIKEKSDIDTSESVNKLVNTLDDYVKKE